MDIRCNLEDLPEVIEDRDEWWERERERERERKRERELGESVLAAQHDDDDDDDDLCIICLQ